MQVTQASSSPIFVVGSSRSGTELLSACLRRHPEINITHETHYFDDLRPRLQRRLRRDPTRSISAEAIAYFRSLSVAPYGHHGNPDQSTIDRQHFERLAHELGQKPDSYFAAYCMITAQQQGKRRWGEKTPRHVYRVAELLQAFPTAKIVHIFRDPRAVVASYRDWQTLGTFSEERRQGFDRDTQRARNSYHPFIISWMWKSAIRTAVAARARYGAQHVHLIRYEDLVLTPERILRDLCAFLETEFRAEMLQVAMDNSSYKAHAAGVGFSTVAVQRWRQKLSDTEIAAVQGRCRGLMEECGYDPACVARHRLAMLYFWLTSPFAVARAAFVNRARFANLPEYLWRRFPLPIFADRWLRKRRHAGIV